MKIILLLTTFFLITVLSYAQDTNEDYTWWNEIHDWEDGDPGWRNWIKITPGYLGPNALPVPPVKKGLITGSSEMEVTASGHFHKDDPTQDISGKIFIPFANNKIAVEIYGVTFEHFAFSEKIRDERMARNKEGKGIAMGDLYFSTLIQIIKNRRFPNTLLRFATKTASGNQLASARYSDSPGYFFDLSFSKILYANNNAEFMPFVGLGFYSWQTNDEMRLQNDALMYALGIDLRKNKWLVGGSWSGYSGYKNERDRPMQLNFEVRKDFEKKAVKFKYLHGLRDWEYKTVRFSFIWKFNTSDRASGINM